MNMTMHERGASIERPEISVAILLTRMVALVREVTHLHAMMMTDRDLHLGRHDGMDSSLHVVALLPVVDRLLLAGEAGMTAIMIARDDPLLALELTGDGERIVKLPHAEVPNNDDPIRRIDRSVPRLHDGGVHLRHVSERTAGVLDYIDMTKMESKV